MSAYRLFSKLSVVVLTLLLSRGAFAQQWTPVVGADQLRALVSGTMLEGTLKEGALTSYQTDIGGSGDAEVNYYAQQPDAFGPDWMIGINIAPVVKNVFAGMMQ